MLTVLHICMVGEIKEAQKRKSQNQRNVGWTFWKRMEGRGCGTGIQSSDERRQREALAAKHLADSLEE